MTIRTAFALLLALPLISSPALAQNNQPGLIRTLTAKNAAKVSATITDAQTGQPVTNFHITIGKHTPPAAVNWLPLASYAPFSIYQKENTFSITTSQSLQDYTYHISAPGYLPQYAHEWDFDPAQGHWDIKLQPAPNITGTILSPEGKPVYDAQIIVITGENTLTIDGPVFRHFNPTANKQTAHGTLKPLLIYNSKIDGSFSIPPQKEKFRLLILSPQGYELLNRLEVSFSSPNTIKLGKWMTLDGSVKYKNKPIPGQSLKLTSILYKSTEVEDAFNPTNVRINYQTYTNPDGSFAFQYVPYQFVNIHLVHEDPKNKSDKGFIFRSDLIKLGPNGFPPIRYNFDNTIIIGTITNADHTSLKSFQSATIEFTSQIPLKEYSTPVSPDGSFAFESITPAELSLAADVSFADTSSLDNYSVENHTIRKTIDLSNLTPPLLLNLGKLPLTPPTQNINTGNTAPDFSATNLSDNSTFNLKDYRGKYILLDFSPAYSGFMFSQIADVNNAYQLFKDRDDIAFVSFVFKNTQDFDPNDPTTYQDKAEWPIAMLDNAADDPATKAFGASEFQCIYLISPEGQIIAKDNDLFGPNIAPTLQKLLPK